MNEIIKGMDNAAEQINENFQTLDAEMETIGTTHFSGIGNGETKTINYDQGMLLFIGRGESEVQKGLYYISEFGVSPIVKATGLNVTAQNKVVTINSFAGTYTPYAYVAK